MLSQPNYGFVERISRKESECMYQLILMNIKKKDQPLHQDLWLPLSLTNEELKTIGQNLSIYRGGVSDGMSNLKNIFFGSNQFLSR